MPGKLRNYDSLRQNCSRWNTLLMNFYLSRMNTTRIIGFSVPSAVATLVFIMYRVRVRRELGVLKQVKYIALFWTKQDKNSQDRHGSIGIKVPHFHWGTVELIHSANVKCALFGVCPFLRMWQIKIHKCQCRHEHPLFGSCPLLGTSTAFWSRNVA